MAPRGPLGRNFDSPLIRQTSGWESSTSLGDGREKTYAWVCDQVASV